MYYDPDKPSEAGLNKKLSGGVFVPLPLGLLMAGMGWLGLRHKEAIQKAVAAGNVDNSFNID